MDLYYHFFDRAAFDPIWGLTWTEFRRRWNLGAWTIKPLRGDGTYDGDSLRDLIAFCVDPEPSEEEVENILSQRSVRWTAKHSGSQFYFMDEIISNVPKLHNKQFSAVVFAGSDFKVLLASAVDAYLNRRIDRRTLRAVLALHTVSDLNGLLRLTPAERSSLGSLTRAQPDMFRPIYRWQDPEAFEGEEWPGCLRETDTRRFVSFVLAAWQGNWQIPRIRDSRDLSFSPPKGHTAAFRDFAISKELVQSLSRRLRHLDRPCVLRSWS